MSRNKNSTKNRRLKNISADESAGFHGLISQVKDLYNDKNRVVPPQDLVQKITGSDIEDKKIENKPAIFAWGIYKYMALGIILVVALTFYIVQVKKKSEVKDYIAKTTSAPKITGFGNSVLIEYKPNGPDTFELREGLNLKISKVFQVENQEINFRVKNSDLYSKIYQLERLNDHYKQSFILPGSQISNENTGKGNLKEFAFALANCYLLPVQFEFRDDDEIITWEFKSHAPEEAPSSLLSSKNISIEYLSSQIITIKQH